MDDTHISLAHGNGGRLMRELIEDVFARHLANPGLDIRADAATVKLNGGEVYMTTDGFTVQPLEFPGGDIGSLAVHGTTNDLAVAGATPLFLSLNVFVEEGLEVLTLDRIVRSLAAAARAVGVRVVAGDTKVVRRGEGGGLYLATTGLGLRERGPRLGIDRVRAGDVILVSGPIGDHGIAVMLAREQFGMHGELSSDVASVLPLTRALLQFGGLRFMRDPTRGGLAAVLHEVAQGSGQSLRVAQEAVPVRPEVQAVCEMLGYDPFYLACEGRVVAVVDRGEADAALEAWRTTAGGESAAIIGEVTEAAGSTVVLATALGGERFLQELEDDPLPRIC